MEHLSKLFDLQDLQYRSFQQKLIPNIDGDTIIGVRTPALRQMAKCMDASFLELLPHKYFEENQLHGFILSDLKDFESVIAELDRFLPFVNNWATCDQMSPKCFRKHRSELLPYIRCWLASDHTYTIRFGMGMLMTHFLDDDFNLQYLQWISDVKSQEYYVRMMQAWYFATALAKQYDAAVLYLTEHRLEPWTHNKAIQKAAESYRISPEKKQYLKTLRIK